MLPNVEAAAAAVSQALAISAFSITVTRAKVLARLRENTTGKVRDLLHCPYCISHWCAFILLMLVNVPELSMYRVSDYILYAFCLVGISAIITGSIFRLLLWQESRIEDLELALNTANNSLTEILGEKP